MGQKCILRPMTVELVKQTLNGYLILLLSLQDHLLGAHVVSSKNHVSPLDDPFFTLTCDRELPKRTTNKASQPCQTAFTSVGCGCKKYSLIPRTVTLQRATFSTPVIISRISISSYTSTETPLTRGSHRFCTSFLLHTRTLAQTKVQI